MMKRDDYQLCESFMRYVKGIHLVLVVYFVGGLIASCTVPYGVEKETTQNYDYFIIDGDGSMYTEQIFHDLTGMPTAGTLMIYKYQQEIDMDFALFWQRIVWTARRSDAVIVGVGWADYTDRCKLSTESAPRQAARQRMICMAPFVYFTPVANSESGLCYDSVEMEDAVCEEDGEIFHVIAAIFETGFELSHHAISRPGEPFARFRGKLRSLYHQIPNLRLLMNQPSE